MIAEPVVGVIQRASAPRTRLKLARIPFGRRAACADPVECGSRLFECIRRSTLADPEADRYLILAQIVPRSCECPRSSRSEETREQTAGSSKVATCSALGLPLRCRARAAAAERP